MVYRRVITVAVAPLAVVVEMVVAAAATATKIRNTKDAFLEEGG